MLRKEKQKEKKKKTKPTVLPITALQNMPTTITGWRKGLENEYKLKIACAVKFQKGKDY